MSVRVRWQQLSNSCPGSTRHAHGWQVIGARIPRQTDPTAMSLIHSATALIYSALALAETFVLLAVVLGLFWIFVRTCLRYFARISWCRRPAENPFIILDGHRTCHVIVKVLP